jgi:hypothetical protein
MNSLLDLDMAGRLAVRIFRGLPWELRGSAPMRCQSRTRIPGNAWALQIDDFNEKYIVPVVFAAVRNRTTHDADGADVTFDFDGTTVRIRRIDSPIEDAWFDFHFDYTPPVPDYGMGVYFWLGEQADVR